MRTRSERQAPLRPDAQGEVATDCGKAGYGDIVPIDPFARESAMGQFYLALTVARLVTLELANRRR